jgi:hypothetical protein
MNPVIGDQRGPRQLQHPLVRTPPSNNVPAASNVHLKVHCEISYEIIFNTWTTEVGSEFILCITIWQKLLILLIY